ncbi:MAG: hypothetical protein M3Y54_00485 [Bacteroidota bacterium]|nr:hypothetical protein [Bacteroidota bacterium]
MKNRLQFQFLWAILLSFVLDGCENTAAPDQLTLVEGRVLRHSDKVPFVGIPMVVEPYSTSFYGPSFTTPIASARTDADGKYSFSFYNKKGLYYAISCDPEYTDRRLDFLPWSTIGSTITALGNSLRTYQIGIGQKNTVDFYPDQNMVILLRLQVRSTRFQQLIIGAGWKLRTNSLDTVIRRGGHWVAAMSESATLRRVGAGGQTLQDSTVYLYALGPIAVDTIRATFRFVQ